MLGDKSSAITCTNYLYVLIPINWRNHNARLWWSIWCVLERLLSTKQLVGKTHQKRIFINCNALSFRYRVRMSCESQENLMKPFHYIINHMHCIGDGKKKTILNFLRFHTCLVRTRVNLYNVGLNNIFKNRFLFVDYTQTLQVNIIFSFLRVRLVRLYVFTVETCVFQLAGAPIVTNINYIYVILHSEERAMSYIVVCMTSWVVHGVV